MFIWNIRILSILTQSYYTLIKGWSGVTPVLWNFGKYWEASIDLNFVLFLSDYCSYVNIFFFNFLEKSINVYLESSKSCPEVELKNVSVVLIKFSKQKKVALYYMLYILKDFYAGLSYFWGWLIKFFWCSHHQIGHRMVSCDL